MFASMGLTISGLIFIGLIAIIYFSKTKFNNIENQIYRYLIILTIFIGFQELLVVYFISIRDKMPLFTELFCKGYIITSILWFVLIFGYTLCISESERIQSFRDLLKLKRMMAYIVLAIVLIIVTFFIPITYTSGSQDQILVIGGIEVKTLYFIGSATALYIARAIYVKMKDSTLDKKAAISLFIFLFIIFTVFQFVVIDLNELTFLYSYLLVGIYFSIENQDELLAKDLEEAKQVAEIANRDKTTFLAKMSHEIRTPMNVIMGYCDYIVKNDNTITMDEIQKESRQVYNASKNLLEIVNNILTYSRIESGREKIEEINYSIQDIVGEVESYARARMDTNDVRFVINLADNLPVNYYGDKLKIYRVILTIVNNAIKYTNQGEIGVKITHEMLENEIAKLHIVVKDTGSGISPEELDEIRTDITEDQTEEEVLLGSGLGLALTKKLVKMLDGTVEISSEYGNGTTVEITVDQKVVNHLEYKDVKTETEDDTDIYFDCSNYNILVVDDNKLNRIVMEKLLKPYKVKYDLLENGQECISRVKTGVKYDLILLDHMMPEMDGIETIRALKKLNIELPPIIAVTANVVTEIKELYRTEGFDGYLSKPIDIKELNRIMQKYFKENGGK